MKVRLEDIPPEGLTIEGGETRLCAQDLGPQVGTVLSAPWARWELRPLGEMVQARGEYRARLGLVCSRCLQETPVDLAGEMDLVFRAEAPVDEEEVQLGEDELEVTFFQGGEIDLTRALVDELGLSLPMAPLCRPDCPGLCPVCGRRMDQGACGCRPKENDPRWAKLAKLEI